MLHCLRFVLGIQCKKSASHKSRHDIIPDPSRPTLHHLPSHGIHQLSCQISEVHGILLSSNLLRISAHLFGAPLPCPSPCPLPGVFSLCPMDHLTVRTLWYFSRYFSHFSLPRNVLHCEGIEPHTFCFLSLIFDSVACATVQWLSLT